ncbi:hypothetical protein BX616_001684 [Lobosporangium transversale]|nr:hypothetical protein BX616_001684 [Lobosporangium transversale]
MPNKPKATFLTLPSEIIVTIFTLSSNPSLVLVCREINHILAPLSKSIATRAEFLLVRYRYNYVKAVIKGLRWTFFDLELLSVLDRIFYKEQTRILEEESRKALLKSATGVQSRNKQSDISPSDSIPDTNVQSTIERPRKKRKKYQLPTPEPNTQQQQQQQQQQQRKRSPDAGNNGDSSSATRLPSTDDMQNGKVIPLPKDFPMPRRLFKSSESIPLIHQLLLRGASPSYQHHYPLVRASQRGDVEMVKLLLTFGAPPDIKALRWACVEEHNEVLDVFLTNGVMPDGQCLSWCVERGKTKMIDRLLKLGVVPDLKTVLGL